METQYNFSNGDMFKVNEQVTESFEKLGLNEQQREELARNMARTAEWIINSETGASNHPTNGNPVRPFVHH